MSIYLSWTFWKSLIFQGVVPQLTCASSLFNPGGLGFAVIQQSFFEHSRLIILLTRCWWLNKTLSQYSALYIINKGSCNYIFFLFFDQKYLWKMCYKTVNNLCYLSGPGTYVYFCICEHFPNIHYFAIADWFLMCRIKCFVKVLYNVEWTCWLVGKKTMAKFGLLPAKRNSS